MVRGVAIVLVPLVLGAAEMKIDHVTVAGRDLKTMQAGLARAGLTPVYGGAHANGVTEMALVSFPDGSYLEAIALQPRADPKAAALHEWARFLKGAGMPCAWALEAPNLEADAARIRAAGIEVPSPVKAGRRPPDGVSLEWETVNIGSEDRGTFFPFLIHDFTPRAQRVYPQGKPVNTEYSGVSRVVVAVRDLDAAIDRYRKAFGLGPATKQADREFGATLALLGDAPVVLAQPFSPDSWIGTRLQSFGEGPCAFLLRAPSRGNHKNNGSKWFGRQISWLDPASLGWHLGTEERP
jgi:catechol 2,3-dioxygenase-like lactoylglutathione lyase family enzyme